jgi:hypothetical protein
VLHGAIYAIESSIRTQNTTDLVSSYRVPLVGGAADLLFQGGGGAFRDIFLASPSSSANARMHWE